MQASTRYRYAVLFWAIVMIVICGILIPAMPCWPEVLTHDEALAKIQEWGPDRTADKIVAFDRVLQADPAVTMPALIIVVDKDGMMHVGFEGPILVEVASLLYYELTPAPWVAPDPTPDPGPWPVIFGALGGFTAGALTVLLLAIFL